VTAETGTTRRGALGRIALAAAGVLGLGYAARQATADDSKATAAAKPRGRELVLYGREMRLHSPGRTPGELPPPGDRPTPLGRLVDKRERPLGSFTSAGLAGAAGALELHTFELDEGSIFGVGAGALGPATFAVIGGTGRYSGATGSYVARQSLRELGGDGTAEFTLTLDNLEA
jgi:hypothetical protein